MKEVVTNMSITYSIEMDNSKFENIQDIIRQITKAVYSLGAEMIKQQLEEMDLYIRDSRDKKRFRCKDKRKTSIKTKIGVVEYSRYLYFDRESNEYVYLLDSSVENNCIGLVNEDVVD